MSDEQRERAVLRTLEDSQADLLDEIREQGERRHQTLLLWQRRTDRRYWVVSVLLTAMIATTITAVVIGAVLIARQQQRTDRVVTAQQVSRKRAVRDSCDERNRLAGGILFFIARVAPDLQPRAAAVFRMQPSCAEYTAAILANRTPAPTVLGHPVPPVP